MSESTFIYFEQPMAAALGLAPKILQKTRLDFLTEGTDWDLTQHAVAYSEEGFDGLLVQLTLAQKSAPAIDVEAVKKAALICPSKPPMPSAEASADKAQAGPVPSTGELWAAVVRYPTNPRQMQCTLGTETIYVQVKDRTKFPLKSQVPVQKKPGTGIYELACREPKRRGQIKPPVAPAAVSPSKKEGSPDV